MGGVGWVGPALVLLLCLLHLAFRVEPSLRYHQSAPPFFTDRPFLEQYLHTPGGPLRGAAAAMAQLNARNALGALVGALGLFGVFFAARPLFRSGGLGAPEAVACVPVVLLAILAGRYEPDFEGAVLGMLLVLAAVNFWDASAAHFPSIRWGGQWVLAMPVFCVGGPLPLLAFTAVGLAHDLARRRRGWPTLAWLTVPAILLGWAATVPAFAWSILTNGWGRELDFALALAAWLAAPAALALAVAREALIAQPSTGRGRQDGPGNQGVQHAGKAVRAGNRRSPTMWWALAVVGTVLLLAVTLDVTRRGVARVTQHTLRHEWNAALDAARRLREWPPATRAQVLRALFWSGRLLDDLFTFPQHRGQDLLAGYQAGGTPSLAVSETLFELGQVNLAERMAHETLELDGSRPATLRLLAKINLALGRPEAARIFLRRLRLAPFHRAEAEQSLHEVENPTQSGAVAELDAVRGRMPRTDEAQPRLPTEMLLRQLLATNRTNRMASEFLVAHQLLAPPPEDPARRQSLVAGLRGASGRACEEALLVWDDTARDGAEGKDTPAIQPATRVRYRQFLEARQRQPNPGQACAALAPEFGDTYWYFLSCGETAPLRGRWVPRERRQPRRRQRTAGSPVGLGSCRAGSRWKKEPPRMRPDPVGRGSGRAGSRWKKEPPSMHPDLVGRGSGRAGSRWEGERLVRSLAPPKPAARRLFGALLLFVVSAWLTFTTSAGAAETGSLADAIAPRPPRIHPDYTSLVIPPNIAPLNFLIEEPADRHRVRIHGPAGQPIEIKAGKDGDVRIPLTPWRVLLEANRGAMIQFDISSQTSAGGWQSFAAVTNFVAREPVDRTLVYRLLKPLFNYYTELGIYQRDLESFRQTPILENRDFGGGCLNCHTFLDHRPDTFLLHIRGQPKGPQPMLLVRSNQVARVDKTAGYPSWHPSGQLLAFSANRLSLFFHTQGETRDVFDAESNLGIYWVSSNRVTTPPVLAQPDRLENWPHWAPDGRYLYFCSARKLRWERYRQVRYDLLRVRFDLDRNLWGEPETVVAADDQGLSASQPRVSPDGRWLLFCLARYGHFPVYQPSSDLYVKDLQTGEQRRLDINSDQADTWHCWSSNGRWVVFSSKRGNGLLARPHFTYVDEAGGFRKPFVLPQRDPAFYDACVQTFNVPELVQGPVTVRASELARGVLAPRTVLTPTDDTRQSHNEEQAGTPPP